MSPGVSFIWRAALVSALLAPAPLAARPRITRVQPNPSAVAAAEIAFNQLAKEKGQWTAFRETAADDAVMFVPQKVLAKDWLKGRVDPPAPVSWQPQKIWVSCDGRTGASTGAWQRPNGTVGYFTTIWRLDDKGRWKWVLDHGDLLAQPRPAEDYLEGHVAKCRRGPGPAADNAPDGVPRPAPRKPQSRRDEKAELPRDESLLWNRSEEHTSELQSH